MQALTAAGSRHPLAPITGKGARSFQPRARIHREVEETTVVRVATAALLRDLTTMRDAPAIDRIAFAGRPGWPT